MPKQSAGVLLYRTKDGKTEVMLAHPGGPFWAKKDEHAWSVPKGKCAEDEDSLEAAKREFQEEIGRPAPAGKYIELGIVKIPSKVIQVWAVEADMDVSTISSNTVKMQWPPRSGNTIEFPEVDRAEWVVLSKAPRKMHKGQSEFLNRLAEKLGISIVDEPPEEKASQQQISLL